MAQPGSITQCIGEIRRGDDAAARRIWDQYSRDLLKQAARTLGQTPRTTADEEDVVASAFGSLFRRMQAGQFSRLDSRDDLWRLLVRITQHKARAQIRRQRRLKRGGGRVAGETDLMHRGVVEVGGLDGLAATGESPALAAAAAESLRALLRALDPELRRVALLKLEGLTNAEIAKRIGKAVPTVERRLRLIRAHWLAAGVSRES